MSDGPRRRRRLVAAAALLAGLAACATRTAPPVITAPRHPDFIMPALPDGAPAAVRGALTRGWQFLQGGDLRGAEREFVSALKGAPRNAALEASLAYTALARHDAGAALAGFERALQREPALVAALAGRGYALVALEREGDALASFEAALAADPSLTDLQARVDVIRFRAVQDLLARAKSAADAGRFDQARAAYEQAIAASPDSAFLYRDLAAVERTAGLTDRALDHLRRAVALDGGDARAQVMLAELLEEGDDPVAALAAYEQARAIDASAVGAAALARLRDRVAALALPEPYRAIPAAARVTRADVAALIGIRLEGLVSRAAARQVVITDVRGHWAQPWITAVVRASIMDTLPNYQFDPEAAVRRGELAQTVARILSLIAAVRPGVSKTWEHARVPVSDVPPSHLSYPAVSAAVAAGVMPLDNGVFRPLDPVPGVEALGIVGRLEALAR